MTSSTKPEVRKDPAAVTSFDIWFLTYATGQTDRQTDSLIAIVGTTPDNDVER